MPSANETADKFLEKGHALREPTLFEQELLNFIADAMRRGDGGSNRWVMRQGSQITVSSEHEKHFPFLGATCFLARLYHTSDRDGFHIYLK